MWKTAFKKIEVIITPNLLKAVFHKVCCIYNAICIHSFIWCYFYTQFLIDRKKWFSGMFLKYFGRYTQNLWWSPFPRKVAGFAQQISFKNMQQQVKSSEKNSEQLFVRTAVGAKKLILEKLKTNLLIHSVSIFPKKGYNLLSH